MDEQGEPSQPAPSLEDLSPEDASRIIHSHRKVRYGTACWPCRQRKVRCDNKHPCENCLKRNHAELCSYKPKKSSANKGLSSSLDEAASRKRAHSFGESKDGSHKFERHEDWPPPDIEQPNLEDTESSSSDRFMGDNAIPSLLAEQSSPDKNEKARVTDMRSILGLDTSAPFPLMSQHHLRSLTQDVFKELPSDREVMKLFQTYKEIAQPFWGFVYDINDLETKLLNYLEDRSRNAGTSGRSSRPVTASWLAILFAVMAVGSQYSDGLYHIRTHDSQKYIQVAFHFLRLGNFLLRPSFDSIQALLLTSFVLLNDMKAEASWALTGLTCRLAQSLGLHRPEPPERVIQKAGAKSSGMIRRQLWWTCVWHDTLTSLSFDRPPMTNFPSCSIPVDPSKEVSDGSYTYLETMYHLMEIISRRLNPDTVANTTYTTIIQDCEAIEGLRRRACPHIQDKSKCKTALDRLQHFGIKLHSNFILSVACRPALRQDCQMDHSQKKDLSKRCKINLTETVRAFLAMHQLSVIPTRSWAFTYHGLSSALLLGILPDSKSDPEVRSLQGDLISALSASATRDGSPEPHVPISDKDIELSGPLYRALTALKSMYDHGPAVIERSARVANQSGCPSGAQTPPAAEGVATNPNPNPGTPGPLLRGLSPNIAAAADPRENAAMAMAEMQNGVSLADLSGFSLAQQANNHSLAVENLTNGMEMDPSQYMAPMDLYESIWGQSPDPWGMDSMQFDFMAQPPPGQPQQQFYF